MPASAGGESSSTSAQLTKDAAREETAFAVWRRPLFGEGLLGLPSPLSATDAARASQAFAAQRNNNLYLADTLISALKDRTLLGDLLAERYLDPHAKPTPTQLREWLKHYRNHADAPAIYARLITLSAKGQIPPQSFIAPLSEEEASLALDRYHAVRALHSLTSPQLRRRLHRNATLDRLVASRLALGQSGIKAALSVVDATTQASSLYAAQLRAEIAQNELGFGDGAQAFSIAHASFVESGKRLSYAAYVAGLAAWQQKNFSKALSMFAAAARAPLGTADTRAGAAFWAARSQTALDCIPEAAKWLQQASAYHNVFYGMLARQQYRRMLNAFPSLAPERSSKTLARSAPSIPVMGAADVEAVEAMPQGHRLFALLQISERARAEALIRRVWPDIARNSPLRHAIQLVAQKAGFDRLSDQLSHILAQEDALADLDGAYPTPKLLPRDGFKMDPALIYALTKLESNFDPKAHSRGGARGLMQIRPMTARFVSGLKPHLNKDGVAVFHVPAQLISRLSNPSVNLELGQRYLLYLAKLNARDDDRSADNADLVRMLASYNAGPSAIAHWENALRNQSVSHDPLFFIEALPFNETRFYVRHALTYLWVYARKMNLPAPSLDALARAQWPNFGDERALASVQTFQHDVTQ